MKYNLKNLKELVKEILQGEDDFYGVDPRFREWLDGFEKELRELLENLEYLYSIGTREDLIKEILGE